MIYGKMWCVVKPSVSIPIFIAAVAIASFSVHVALTLNSAWVKGFVNGGQKAVAAARAETPPAKK